MQLNLSPNFVFELEDKFIPTILLYNSGLLYNPDDHRKPLKNSKIDIILKDVNFFKNIVEKRFIQAFLYHKYYRDGENVELLEWVKRIEQFFNNNFEKINDQLDMAFCIETEIDDVLNQNFFINEHGVEQLSFESVKMQDSIKQYFEKALIYFISQLTATIEKTDFSLDKEKIIEYANKQYTLNNIINAYPIQENEIFLEFGTYVFSMNLYKFITGHEKILVNKIEELLKLQPNLLKDNYEMFINMIQSSIQQ